MVEIELIPEELTEQDNTLNVEMSTGEIWLIKHLIQKHNPKKIVEIGVSAGGNTVNLLQWKNKDAQLFSIDIAEQWYRDEKKLSGFMADDVENKDNWTIFRGNDFLDVREKIGDGIDFIVIDTVHAMPGEFFSFLGVLPYLKDGCIVILHDIHLNMIYFSENKYTNYTVSAYCNGLLFGGVSSNKKWSLKTDIMSNIGAFVVDESTRQNIKDIFHIFSSAWYRYPSELNLTDYTRFIKDNYPADCFKIFDSCLNLQSNFFFKNNNQIARLDIINSNNKESTVEILEKTYSVEADYPDWFNSDEGKGLVIHSKFHPIDLKLKCIKDGTLTINLGGPEVLDASGNPLPKSVKYTKLIMNDENMINEEIITSYEKPHVISKDVNDGDIIQLHVDWKPS